MTVQKDVTLQNITIYGSDPKQIKKKKKQFITVHTIIKERATLYFDSPL